MIQHVVVDRKFAIIDEWVLDLDISDRALRLYAVLLRYADKDTMKAFPSRNTLAERLRCSHASVDRASAELVAAGLLKKEHRYNNSIVYTVVVSSPVTTPLITGDDTVSSLVTTAIITGDELTITNEREPLELEPFERARSLSKDWKPKEELYSEDKYSVLDIDDEADSFRNWCLANGKKYKDWDAAFRNWLKKGLDFYERKHYKENERDRQKRELDAWIASLPEEEK